MPKSSKTAWLNLATGLLFLSSAARDTWAPKFLSISGGRHGDIWLSLVCAALALTAACRNFLRVRRPAR